VPLLRELTLGVKAAGRVEGGEKDHYKFVGKILELLVQTEQETLK
jgi:hypothetical protein